MKSFALGGALAIAVALPAFAGQCEQDVAKIDRALAGAEVPPDQRAEIEDMRNQAVQLCGAGNEQEGLDVTAEAKALLAIE
jgi:hypothetical protein